MLCEVYELKVQILHAVLAIGLDHLHLKPAARAATAAMKSLY